MKIKRASLSVVMPAFNEEESLGYVLTDTLRDLPKIVSDYEVIIVDDGSIDKTSQIADAYVKKNKHVRVIHQPHSGYNQAMITGIKAAKKDYVVYMNAGGHD